MGSVGTQPRASPLGSMSPGPQPRLSSSGLSIVVAAGDKAPAKSRMQSTTIAATDTLQPVPLDIRKQQPEAVGAQASASLLARRVLASALGPVVPPQPQPDSPWSQPTTSQPVSPGPRLAAPANTAPSPTHATSISPSNLTAPLSPTAGSHTAHRMQGVARQGSSLNLGMQGSGLNLSFRGPRGSMTGGPARMSFSGAVSPKARLSQTGSMRISSTGGLGSGGPSTRPTKKRATVKEYVAHHFWKHYEKYRQAEIATLHASMDIEAQKQARSQKMGQAMEFGFLGNSYEVHVNQVLQAKRDREDALPLQRDEDNQWAAFLRKFSREDAAAIVIQRWWRAFLEFRKITWPELYEHPLPQKEKPPAYVWSSSESEESDSTTPTRMYTKKPKPGNKAGFGTSAVKPMNKGAHARAAAAKAEQVIETGLIWQTAAAAPLTHVHDGSRPRAQSQTEARYMTGVSTGERNMKRRKKKVMSQARVHRHHGQHPATNTDSDTLGGEPSPLGPWQHGDPSGEGYSTDELPVRRCHSRRATHVNEDLTEGDMGTSEACDDCQAHEEEWEDSSDGSCDSYGASPKTSRSRTVESLLRNSRDAQGISSGPIMGHLKFWGALHNPKELHDPRFFLPHLGQVHVLQSERDMFQGLVHVKSVSQVLKPFVTPPVDPANADPQDPAGASAAGPDSPPALPLTASSLRLSRRSSKRLAQGVSTVDEPVADSNVGHSARAGPKSPSSYKGQHADSTAHGADPSLKWVHQMHANLASRGGLPHQLQRQLAAPPASSQSVRRGTASGARTASSPVRPKTGPAALLQAAGSPRPGTTQTPPDLSEALTSQRHRLLPRITMYTSAYEDDPETLDAAGHEGVTGNPGRYGQRTSAPAGASKSHAARADTNALMLIPQTAILAGRASVPLPIHSLDFKRSSRTPAAAEAAVRSSHAVHPAHKPPRTAPAPMLILQSLRPLDQAGTCSSTAQPGRAAATAQSAGDLGHTVAGNSTLPAVPSRPPAASADTQAAGSCRQSQPQTSASASCLAAEPSGHSQGLPSSSLELAAVLSSMRLGSGAPAPSAPATATAPTGTPATPGSPISSRLRPPGLVLMSEAGAASLGGGAVTPFMGHAASKDIHAPVGISPAHSHSTLLGSLAGVSPAHNHSALLGSLTLMEGRSAGKAPPKASRLIAGRVLRQPPLPPAGAIAVQNRTSMAGRERLPSHCLGSPASPTLQGSLQVGSPTHQHAQLRTLHDDLQQQALLRKSHGDVPVSPGPMVAPGMLLRTTSPTIGVA